MNIKLITYKLLSHVTSGKRKLHYRNKYRELKNRCNPYRKLEMAIEALAHRVNDGFLGVTEKQNVNSFFLRNIYISLSQGVDSKYFLENNLLWDQNISLLRICLKDLKVSLFDVKDHKWHIHSLEESPAYKALQGDQKIYNDYCKQKNPYGGGDVHSLQRFDDLIASLEKNNGFGYQHTGIVIDKNFKILDGQHRASYLLYKFGPEKQIICVMRG